MKCDRQTLLLAFCIALFAPIWAILAPYIGITTGGVALICAGIFVEAGNTIKQALPVSIGFLLGDLWAVLVVELLKVMPFGHNMNLFILLFIGGGLAVLIASLLPKRINLSAWLSGFAIGLLILAPVRTLGSLPLQIAISMLVGVWYIGVFVSCVMHVVGGHEDE